MLLRVHKILLFFALFIGPHAWAYDTAYDLEDAVYKETEVFGDGVMQKLENYQSEVEKDGKAVALKLCEGYRRANNQGPTSYHKKYMYSEQEAAFEWAKILYQGGAQVVSGSFGLKADYIEAKGLGYFEFESWFGSLYTMFLVNSSTFLEGAMHCLAKPNQSMKELDRDLQYFAGAIVAIDYLASLGVHTAAYTGAGFATTKIFGLITSVSRWAWNPLARNLGYLTKRVKFPKFALSPVSTSANQTKWFTGALGVAISARAIQALNQLKFERDSQASMARELLKTSSDDTAMNANMKILKDAFLKIDAYRTLLDNAKASEQDKAKSFDAILKFVEAKITLIKLQEFEGHFKKLEEKYGKEPSGDSTEIRYYKLLKGMLPLLEELVLV